MSDMFKSKQVDAEYHSTPQDDRIKELWDMVKPQIQSYINTQAGKPYPNEQVAPLTGMERQSLASLQDYLNSPYASQSDMFNLAKGTTEKLMSEDPWASGGAIDYTSKQLKKYLETDLLPATRQRAAATGSLYSSGYGLDEETQVANVMDELGKYAYQYQDSMNARKANLVPTAMAIGDYETNEPIMRLMNTMGMAGYERSQVTQPQLTASYNDYLRMLQEMQGILGTGTQLTGQSGGYVAYPTFQPSPYTQYVLPTVNAMATMLSASNTGGAGGGAGGATNSGAANSGGKAASAVAK